MRQIPMSSTPSSRSSLRAETRALKLPWPTIALPTTLAVALAVGAIGILAQGCPSQETFNGNAVDREAEPLELVGTNWNGEPFRLADQKGKVTVVFFGYTYCPDVCPFTLAKMKSLYEELGHRAEEVSMVFVSVDPGRDTLEKLASYVPSFDQRFYGVRLDSVEETREEFDLEVTYGQPREGPGTDSFYYVDHTGTFFIFDREGRLRVTFPPNAKVDRMLPDIRKLLQG